MPLSLSNLCARLTNKFYAAISARSHKYLIDIYINTHISYIFELVFRENWVKHTSKMSKTIDNFPTFFLSHFSSNKWLIVATVISKLYLLSYDIEIGIDIDMTPAIEAIAIASFPYSLPFLLNTKSIFAIMTNIS